MRPVQEIAYLVLEELQIPTDVSRFSNRISAQKAIYLAQQAGLDLGYRFSWYVKGPYSRQLADDYFDPDWTEGPEPELTLTDAARSALREVRAVIADKPQSAKSEDWLEILGSVHYLKHVSRLSEESAHGVIHREKPRLEPYFEEAWQQQDRISKSLFQSDQAR